MISFEITGLQSVINKMKKAEEFIKSNDVFDFTASLAKQYAEELCPLDTGELLQSIYIEVLDGGFELGATAGHAIFNEYGCYNLPRGSVSSPVPAKYMGFRPFLRPALYRATKEFPKIFGKKFAQVVSHG